ncbi:polyprenyl synthetase family protein [Streptococcus sp. X16XC17]|uniref:polyprenyl synthetase family protein n=1 Tax=unclassified Streptococcus TaxID=2608887 RepID=UPI00066FE8B8|nr:MULTISPECIES: farnesyl diphosphate synthase [unclassified Streptococcus]TCD46007.1 polyprenyl synthetase family protein [Streptococcus sp. X16XC17]
MEKLAGIDTAIRRYYASQDAISSDLIEAILYSVDSGGKRIRPLMLLQVLEGFGLELKEAHFDVAAAVEMIHTGSLIHDDLPAMDDDDYRRGRLTNHKKFDEATAILAGDSLFLDAYGLIAEADLPARIQVRLVQALSRFSGTFGMVGGQKLDMAGEGRRLSLEELQAIHAGKTGALLTFPFLAAGIIAEKDEKICGQLVQAGSLIGHAFQVRDDILDVTATFEEIGKTPQKDLVAEKSTYPSLFGSDQSYHVLNQDLDQAIAIFQKLEEQEGFDANQILQMIERLRLHA